jgi:hypothetical protein
MYAMQYEILLPTDYDMGIIRTRVATRGHATDNFGGLRAKAYLIREATDVGAVNAYAPFYLWDDTNAMGSFLWGGRGFDNIVRDFGRPTVQTWAGVTALRGPADFAYRATKETIAFGYADEAPKLVRNLRERVEATALHDDVFLVALVVDPRTWEAVVFTLWNSIVDELRVPDELGRLYDPDLVTYEVLHLSEPAPD